MDQSFSSFPALACLTTECLYISYMLLHHTLLVQRNCFCFSLPPSPHCPPTTHITYLTENICQLLTFKSSLILIITTLQIILNIITVSKFAHGSTLILNKPLSLLL